MKRKVVITGASSDIGLAIAKRFIDNETETVLHGNKNLEGCRELAKSYPDNCKVVACNFANPDETDNFLKELKEVDILINGAALNAGGLLSNYPDDKLEIMLQINIVALVKITRAAINEMLRKRKGVIINISSVTASRGNRGTSIYAGTKGFMESMSRPLTAEYGKKGIRINNVAPGPIDAGELKKTKEYAGEEVKNLIVSKRLGTPEDVAALTAFLASPEAEFINGKTFGVDGGFITGV